MIPVGSVTSQLLVDVSGTPFGGSPTWTDATSWLMTSPKEDGSASFNIAGWGRQAWLGDVSATTFSFTLRNIDGRWTPARAKLADNATTNPFFPWVKYGMRVRYTESIAGITVDMCDGYVTDITGTPRNGNFWTVQINCVDIFGRMGTTTPLRGWLTEEMMVDGPSCLYQLQEDEGSTSFGDLTTNFAPLVVANSKYGAGVIDAGQTPSGTGLLNENVATFDNTAFVGTRGGSWLAGVAPTIPTGAYTVEMWVQMPTVAPTAGNDMQLLSMSTQLGSGTRQSLIGLMLDSSGHLNFNVGPATTLGAAVALDGNMHQIVASVQIGSSAQLYFDTKELGSDGSGLELALVGAPLEIGHQPGDFNGYSGAVAFVAIYPTTLSTGRILAHFNAGSNAFAGERTDLHVARILSYRPNTGSALDPGFGNTGSGDCTGETEQQALLDCSSAEGGLLYSDGGGLVRFLNRGHNFNPVPVLTLDAANGEVDIPTTFVNNIANVVNDLTVSRPNGADQRAYNAAHADQYGDITQTITANVDTDQHALDIANWNVAQGVLEQNGIPTLTVNVYALASTAQALKVLQLRPLDCVSLINVPGVPPSVTMVVQAQGGGYDRTSESISVPLYCTPMPTSVLTSDGIVNGVAVAGDTSDSAIYVAAY